MLQMNGSQIPTVERLAEFAKQKRPIQRTVNG